MPAMPRPRGKGKKVAYDILGMPPYMNPKSWRDTERIREKIEQDSYRKVK